MSAAGDDSLEYYEPVSVADDTGGIDGAALAACKDETVDMQATLGHAAAILFVKFAIFFILHPPLLLFPAIIVFSTTDIIPDITKRHLAAPEKTAAASAEAPAENHQHRD